MEGDVHVNNTFLSREMIILVSLLIQNIPKENAFRSLGVQLGMIQLQDMDIENTSKNFGRNGGMEELREKLDKQKRGD